MGLEESWEDTALAILKGGSGRSNWRCDASSKHSHTTTKIKTTRDCDEKSYFSHMLGDYATVS